MVGHFSLLYRHWEEVMGVQGRLTKAEMGVTMPVDAPAYGKKPYHFRKARMLRFDYETDPDKAAQLIPKQLSLTDPATGFLLINEYPWSTFGPYKEAILGVNVLYGGQVLHYLSHLMLDSSCPILGGREIYGVPKKMGVVELIQHEDNRFADAFRDLPEEFGEGETHP